MSHGKLPCPECGTLNDAPAEGTKKITCSSCGVILVLNKVYGDNWPAQARKHADATPAKPKIVSRRDKMKKADTADEPEPSRSSRGSSRRGGAPTTSRRKKMSKEDAIAEEAKQRKTRSEQRKAASGMSPAFILGSVGVFIIVGVVAFMMYQGKQEEQAEFDRKQQEKEIAKKKAAADKKAAMEKEVSEQDAASEAAAAAATANTEQPAAVKKTEPKKPKKLPRRKREPFPTDGVKADVLEKINGAITLLKDLENRDLRTPGDTCFEHRKEAIPLLINSLMALDMSVEDEARRAWPLLDVLRTVSEHSTKWDRNMIVMKWPTDEKELKDARQEREIIALDWWKWWDKNKTTWKPPVDSEEDF